MLTSYQETKTADSFTWVYLNAGSATHTLKVWAEFTPSFTCTPSYSSAACTGSPTGTNSENGYVGNRTLVVTPGHFASDASVPISG
jgi:hypothetical protein